MWAHVPPATNRQNRECWGRCFGQPSCPGHRAKCRYGWPLLGSKTFCSPLAVHAGGCAGGCVHRGRFWAEGVPGHKTPVPISGGHLWFMSGSQCAPLNSPFRAPSKHGPCPCSLLSLCMSGRTSARLNPSPGSPCSQPGAPPCRCQLSPNTSTGLCCVRFGVCGSCAIPPTGYGRSLLHWTPRTHHHCTVPTVEFTAFAHLFMPGRRVPASGGRAPQARQLASALARDAFPSTCLESPCGALRGCPGSLVAGQVALGFSSGW